MLWNTPADPPIAVVRDLDRVRDALEQALRQADSATRPGLEQALAVLAQFDASDEELVADWVRRRLAAAGLDPRTQEVEAIAALRKELPGMNLRAAAKLAAQAAAQARVG
jgi:2-oxo-4-hydroxy-4-carboxy--5-ureidoimidazoline (OHCU) decarboxylase